MGSGGTCLLLVLDILSGPLISLVYPLFATIQAVENSSNNDIRPLLTYWVLYSLITIFELLFSSILQWIPIWGLAKTIVNCVLVLPSFIGSAYVYEQFLKPLVSDPQFSMNFSNSTGLADIFNELLRILTAALSYIKDNGQQIMGGGADGSESAAAGSGRVSNFEDGSTYNGFGARRSTYNGFSNRSRSHRYDDRRFSNYEYDD